MTIDTDGLLFSIGALTVFIGYLAFAGWIIERRPGGSPQWEEDRDE